MSSTISPTANARFPLEICASVGRNGAPPARPSSSRPIAIDSSSRNSLASARATSGITTKFATSDRMTSRRLRSGATIALIVNPKPMASMLETTNRIMQIEMAACFRSMRFSPVLDGVSEADRSGHLERISLVRGAVAELLEELDAGIEPLIGEDHVRHEPDGVDGVSLAGLILGDRRPRLRRGL